MASRQTANKVFCLFIVWSFIISGLLVPGTGVVAQTDPPAFGAGDWQISDTTVMTDKVLRIKGNIRVMSGGSLTLENTTILLDMKDQYTYKFEVRAGGALYVYNGSLIGAFDEPYSFHIEPGARLRMKNSTVDRVGATVTGSDDVIIEDSHFIGGGVANLGIVVICGKPKVYRTTFEAHDYSIRVMYGDIHIKDCFFKDSVHAFYDDIKCSSPGWPWIPTWIGMADICMGPRHGTVQDSYITNTLSVAVYIVGSNITLMGNTIINANSDGLYVASMENDPPTGPPVDIPAEAYVVDNDFISNDHGIFVSAYRGETVNLVNNNFIENRYDAVLFQESIRSVGYWHIDDEIIVDSSSYLRTPITIMDGGHMQYLGGRLFNTETILGFYPLPNPGTPLWLEVKDGGRLTMDKVTVRPMGAQSDDIHIAAMEGSHVRITNSTIQKAGYGWGGQGELGGIYTKADDFVMEDSTVQDGLYGLITGGGSTEVRRTSFSNVTYGMYAQAGSMEAYDSRVTYAQAFDAVIEDGDLDLINTTINEAKYDHRGIGTFDVYWRCDLLTMWQNGEPVGGVDFLVKEKDGTEVATGTTNGAGLSDELILREFTDTGPGREDMSPHSVTGTLMNMTNSSSHSVNGNIRLTLYLEDNGDPFINITSPGLVVHQTNNTLVVNGTAWDLESGLARVQWSYDRDLWYDATGLEAWNFSVVMAYGTTAIHVRALDKAGNEMSLRLVATIDKDEPYLFILNPKDGFITPLRSVLVEGFAESGSTVTVNNITVEAIDGKFRMAVPLVEGGNVLRATAVDSTGNMNTTSVTVYSDTTPPVIVVEHPPEELVTNRLEDRNLAVKGRTEPGARLTINGVSIPLGQDGTFSFAMGLEEGLNVINFLVVDPVGNQNTTTRRVVFDLVKPVLSVYSPEDDTYTNRTSVKVTGLTEPEITVVLRNGDITVSTVTSREGRFEVDIDLMEGENLISVTALDIANNSDVKTRRVMRDTTPPRIVLFDVVEGMVVDSSRFMLEGQTEVGAKVKVNNELVSLGFTGEFSTWVDLPSANNTFRIEAVDMAGNRAYHVIHINRKAETTPEPTNVHLRPDYFPWAVLVAVLVLIVQWVVLTRQSYVQANKAPKVEEEYDPGADLDGRKGPPPRPAGARERVRHSRSRPGPAPVKDEGPEFEEHEAYDEDAELEALERELDDEVEIEIYQGGVRR